MLIYKFKIQTKTYVINIFWSYKLLKLDGLFSQEYKYHFSSMIKKIINPLKKQRSKVISIIHVQKREEMSLVAKDKERKRRGRWFAFDMEII